MKQLNKRRLAILAAVSILLMTALALFPTSALAATRGDDAAQAPTPAWFDCFYNVQRGDTLFSIAVRNHTTVWTLMQLNRIYNPNLIYAGMRLRLPCPEPTPTPPPPSGICSYYIVQRGDYLKLIAARFGVSYEDIAKLNRIYNPSVIYPGMRLAIPCGSTTTPPPVNGRKTYTSTRHHYTMQYPESWNLNVQTSAPGPGSDPEYVYLRSTDGLPTVLIYALRGAPPITGYENCTKNVMFRGLPACSISLPFTGQTPAQRLLIFQRGNDYFQLAIQYSNPSQLGIFDDILSSFMFTQ